MAVCVLPGTELAFSSPVTVTDFRYVVNWKVETLAHATAIFRQVNKNEEWKHHDALEFPDGRIVLLTRLSEGQEATVLQLPAQPASAAETDARHTRTACRKQRPRKESRDRTPAPVRLARRRSARSVGTARSATSNFVRRALEIAAPIQRHRPVSDTPASSAATAAMPTR